MKSNPFVRRIIVMLLTGIYFFVANGLVLEKQFCCGNITSINLSLGGESNCPLCPKNNKCNKNCCNSKFVVQKIDDSQKTSTQIKINQLRYNNLSFSLPYYFQSVKENDSIVNIEAFTIPPLYIHEPVYIVNRTIRI